MNELVKRPGARCVIRLDVYLPVDPTGTFLRLDVDIIVIDINLGNLHLEVVGQKANGFPHRAEARAPWRLEQRGRGRNLRRAWSREKRCNI